MKNMQLFSVRFNLCIFEKSTGRLTVVVPMVAGTPDFQSAPYKDTTEDIILKNAVKWDMTPCGLVKSIPFSPRSLLFPSRISSYTLILI
jgi:hypothetical protein